MLKANFAKETNIALKWFRENEMKSNDDKCHLIIANKENEFTNIGSEVIPSSESVDLLEITIDKNLNFTDHVTGLIKKGNQKLYQKLYALARISKYFIREKLTLHAGGRSSARAPPRARPSAVVHKTKQ